jgi:hypothetical protein
MAGSPIIVSLSTTDITKDVTWERKDGGVAHAADAYFTEPTVIPNPIVNIDSLFGDLAGVGTIRSNESQSTGAKPDFTGGGVYSTRIEDSLANTQIGQKNNIDIMPLTADFMTKARATGGVTMSLILSGKNDNTAQYSEHKYIRGAVETDQFNSNEFYKNFSFITFHSKEAQSAVAPTNTFTNQLALRKSFSYSYISIPLSNIAGMQLTSALNGDNQIILLGTDWSSIQGLSANAVVNFQGINTPPNQNEILTAGIIGSQPPGVPNSISCSNFNLRYIGFNGTQGTFRTITGGRSLFSNSVGGNYQHNGNIAFADPTFGVFEPTTRFQIQSNANVPFLRLRNQNALGFGSKNLLELRVTAPGQIRFFGSSGPTLGIVVGSYIELSGCSVASNNGIYQVIATYDGVPGEQNNSIVISTSAPTTTAPALQYLELSRSITPEQSTTAQIRVRNVSNLPILHIKYEYTP